MKYYGAINDGKDLVTKEYVDSHTGGGLTIDDIYPIGSVYQTLDSRFDPSVRWGGIWSRLQGAFLVGATNPTDSTIYDDTATTVAASSYYTIPITLSAGDVFTVTLSTGSKTMFEYGESRTSSTWTYSGGSTLQNTGSNSVTVVECAKWFGAADDTATEPISGNALVTLTAEQSGSPVHSHDIRITSAGPSTNVSGSAGPWAFTNMSALARVGSTANVSNKTNTAISSSGSTRYKPSANSYSQDAGTTNQDTVTIAVHTHTLNNHTHVVSGNTDDYAQDAVNSHNNMPPYLTVYMWKRIA